MENKLFFVENKGANFPFFVNKKSFFFLSTKISKRNLLITDKRPFYEQCIVSNPKINSVSEKKGRTFFKICNKQKQRSFLFFVILPPYEKLDPFSRIVVVHVYSAGTAEGIHWKGVRRHNLPAVVGGQRLQYEYAKVCFYQQGRRFYHEYFQK